MITCSATFPGQSDDSDGEHVNIYMFNSFENISAPYC